MNLAERAYRFISLNEPPQDKPPLRPEKLSKVASVIVIGAHIIFFASFIYLAQPEFLSLGGINAELIPEGDFFEAEAITEADINENQQINAEMLEEPEFALPPPIIMNPESPSLPAKKEVREDKDKNKENQHQQKKESRNIAHASEKREAQAQRRYGAPGGRGSNSSSGNQATCLAHIASSLRRHSPGVTSLGGGHVVVVFHINPGGGLSLVSASGTSPAHEALARRIVSASHGPSTCGAAFVRQNIYFD